MRIGPAGLVVQQKIIDMQNLKISTLFALLLMAGLVAEAQTLKIDIQGPPAPKLAPGISVGLKGQIIGIVEQHLNAYAQAASLLDERERRVTSASIDRFRALFNAAAELPEDYLEFVPSQPVTLSKYCNDVSLRLETRGVQVQINSARLLEIIDDQTGFYVVVVEVDKSIYNYLSEKGGAKTSTSGRHFKHKFYFDVLKSNLDVVTIHHILGEPRRPAADYVRYLGPSVGVFLPIAQPTFSPYWNDNHAGRSKLSINGSPSFSAGFEFLTNRLLPRSATQKNLFITAGIHFTLTGYKPHLEELNIGEFDATAVRNTHQLMYRRFAEDIQAEELINVGALTVPLGLGLLIKESKKSDVFIAARILPTFSLFNSGNLSGTGMYIAALPEAMWQSNRPNSVRPDQLNDDNAFGPFIIGERALEGTPELAVKPFSLSLQLSPHVYFHLSNSNPNWSLLLGLDFTYGFGSLFEHQAVAGDLFRFPDEYSGSIPQHYTSGMSSFAMGLRIGLHHRLTTKP
jgi:hypothetical protein